MRTGWRRRIAVVAAAVTAVAGGSAAMPTPAVAAAAVSAGPAAPARSAAADAKSPKAKQLEKLQQRGAPVSPQQHILRQPDGTTVVAQRKGDAARNWYEVAGHTVAKNSAGYWRYATSLDAAGQPVAGDTPANGRSAPPAKSKDLHPSKDQMPARTVAAPAVRFTGTQKTLVLLAAFTDRGPVGSTPAQWNSKFFGATNSLQSYYRTASYNKLDVVPAAETSGTANDGVVGWLTLPMRHPDPRDDFVKADSIAYAAITASNPYVDYAAYDTNRDGVVSPSELHITVIVAGYETSYGDTCGPSVWGHQTWLAPAANPDGVQVAGQGYTMFGESHCDTEGAHTATLGIIAHEFGHDLGWPDLYDIDGTSSGIGGWSLMSGGSWGTRTLLGDSPVLPDAWSKYYQGWTTPIEVTSSTVASIGQASTSPSVYRMLANPGGVDEPGTGSGEYFLVENRQPNGLDYALPGCGLIVYHVDESVAGNWDDAHRLVDIEEADGLSGLDTQWYNGAPGDAFHGVANQQRFNNTTVPSSKLYSGAATPASLTQTGGCAATMTPTLTGANTTAVAGTYSPLTPVRLLDTRSGAPVPAKGTRTVQITGRGGVPAVDQVDSVVINVTAVQSRSNGYATVYPGGTALPSASNLNFPGNTRGTPNLVVVRVGTTGTVNIYNGSTGATDYLVDVVGYYRKAGTPGSRFSPMSPKRILDTRSGAALGAGAERVLTVAGGVSGVPSNATGVVMNVTAANATAASYLTVYPAGRARPTTSNLNWAAGTPAVANLVYTPVGTNGQVRMFNSRGTTHLLADVVGWFAPNGAFVYRSSAPKRVIDTRVPIGVPTAAKIGAGRELAVDLTTTASGVPVDAAALVGNTTVTQTTTNGFLTLWPSGTRPSTSVLNWRTGMTIANLASTQLGTGGVVRFYNSAGATHLITDVSGWYVP